MDTVLVNSFCFESSSFTSGNPTMICLITDHTIIRVDTPSVKGKERRVLLSDEMMQSLACEFNQSVTAFVTVYNTEGDSNETSSFTSSSHFAIQWFSPTCETPICGHGTLAASSVLWQLYNNTHNSLYFHTLKSGIFTATLHKDNCNKITIDLPVAYSKPARESNFEQIIKLVLKDMRLQDCHYCVEASRLLLRLPDDTSRSELESLYVDTNKLMAVHQREGGESVKGIIVTVKSNDEEYDFYSRYFAPWWGNHEDHVTGASHTTLVPYWSNVLNKRESDIMKSCQCSPERGGHLEVMLNKDRVLLTGVAVVVMQGNLLNL